MNEMTKIFLKIFQLTCISFIFVSSVYSQEIQKGSSKQLAEYVCTPCGNDCDDETYHSPGKCPHCQMPLVKKTSVTFNNIAPSEICSYIQKHPGVVLLDVRT